MAREEYRALLEQVEALLLTRQGFPDTQLQLLHRSVAQVVGEIDSATGNTRRASTSDGRSSASHVVSGGTFQDGTAGACNCQAVIGCPAADLHVEGQSNISRSSADASTGQCWAHEVLPLMVHASGQGIRTVSKPSASALTRIPEVPSIAGVPEHFPRLACLREQFVQAQIRAVARRLIPPSSIAPGTQLQVLDENSKAWQDAVVQGLSPAGTCLQVTIEETKQTIHASPARVRPQPSGESIASGPSAAPVIENDLETGSGMLPPWLQGTVESNERQSQQVSCAQVSDSRSDHLDAATVHVVPANSLPSDLPSLSKLHDAPIADNRVAWVDPVTFWDSVRRNEQQRQCEEIQNATPSTGTQVIKRFHQAMQRAHTKMVVTGRVVMHDPTAAIVPLVVLLCLLGLGLWGVYTVSDSAVASRRGRALTVALSAAQSLMNHINSTMTPASTVAMLIMLQPSFPEVNQTFFKVAPELVTDVVLRNGVITIVLCPNGIVQSIIPQGLPGWNEVYRLDLLKNLTWRRDALRTVELSEQGMVMTGPVRLRAGPIGLVTRFAVFVEGAGPNETFNAPGEPYNCSACYRPARPATATSPAKPQAKFWGFSQLNVDWEILTRNASRLYDVCNVHGLVLQMTYVTPAGVNQTIASCGGVLGKDPLFVNVDIMHNHWVMAVTDQAGWQPAWLGAVITIVVLVSLAIALLLLIVLVNRREHMWLLQAMLPKEVISTLQRGEAYCQSFDNVTILFSDVVSYTTMASQLAPIDIVSILNEMYSAYDALVDDYECYKVETIGDAFFAVCGTQGESPTVAAAKIAGLALAMVERTRSLLASGSSDQRLQIRIGMHSGPVVGAVLGKKMPHFCLCGDAVNVASRMESNSSPMRIHMSSTTTELLELGGSRRWMPSTDSPGPENSLVIQPRGPVEIKGKGVMNTYWLDSVEGITGVKGGRGGHRPTGDGSGPRRRSMRPPGTSGSEAPGLQLTLLGFAAGTGTGARAEAKPSALLQDRASPMSQPRPAQEGLAQPIGPAQALQPDTPSLTGAASPPQPCPHNCGRVSCPGTCTGLAPGLGPARAAAPAASPFATAAGGVGQDWQPCNSSTGSYMPPPQTLMTTANSSLRWSSHSGPGSGATPSVGPVSNPGAGAASLSGTPAPAPASPPSHASASSSLTHGGGSSTGSSAWDLVPLSVVQALRFTGKPSRKRPSVDLRIFQARRAPPVASASASNQGAMGASNNAQDQPVSESKSAQLHGRG